MRLYIFGAVTLVVLGGVALAAAHAGRRGARSSERLMDVALLAAFAAIVVVTIRPSDGDHEVRLRPFADIMVAVSPPLHRGWIADVVGNILLFVPFGVVLFLRHVTARRTVCYALGLSIAVELVQLLLPGRTTAVDDVICNVTGAALGWCAAWLVHGPSPLAAPER